ncbi:hypothetical protein HGM15179_004380, partial [Zosterops borbonicus]
PTENGEQNIPFCFERKFLSPPAGALLPPGRAGPVAAPSGGSGRRGGGINGLQREPPSLGWDSGDEATPEDSAAGARAGRECGLEGSRGWQWQPGSSVAAAEHSRGDTGSDSSGQHPQTVCASSD